MSGIWGKLFRQKKAKPISFRSLDDAQRGEPVEPWAFMRVKNEIRTLGACLDSIAPVLKKGVIGYHRLRDGETDDGSIEYIENFCRSHPGFVPQFYDHAVVPAMHPSYSVPGGVAPEDKLAAYYNNVLNRIPEREWLIKIDADQVYDTGKLRKLLYLPANEKEFVTIHRINLHYQGDELYVVKNLPFSDVGDHWLMVKDKLGFVMDMGKDGTGNFFAWELLCKGGKEPHRTLARINTNLLTWHFPCLKGHRGITPEELTLFTEFPFAGKTQEQYRYTNDMVDRERILEICRSFPK